MFVLVLSNIPNENNLKDNSDSKKKGLSCKTKLFLISYVIDNYAKTMTQRVEDDDIKESKQLR